MAKSPSKDPRYATAAPPRAPPTSWTPLREDFFSVPLLSSREKTYLVRKASEAAQEVVERARSTGGPVAWKHVEKIGKVQIYSGQPRSIADNDADRTPSLCGVATTPGTVKEVAELLQLGSTSRMRSFANDHPTLFYDGIILYDLHPRTREQPMHQVTAKWIAVQTPKGILNRDFVFLECQDRFEDSHGRKGWILSMHSIKLPGVHDLHDDLGLVRGSLYHSGLLVVESDRPGYVDVISIMQMNLKRRQATPHKFLRSLVQFAGEIRSSIRTARLNRQRYLNDLELVPKRYRSKCGVCQDSFSLLLLRKYNCRKCGEVVCGVCSKEFQIKTPKFVQQIKLRVCIRCFQQVTLQSSSSQSQTNQPKPSQQSFNLSFLAYHDDAQRASSATQAMEYDIPGEGYPKVRLESVQKRTQRRGSQRPKSSNLPNPASRDDIRGTYHMGYMPEESYRHMPKQSQRPTHAGNRRVRRQPPKEEEDDRYHVHIPEPSRATSLFDRSGGSIKGKASKKDSRAEPDMKASVLEYRVPPPRPTDEVQVFADKSDEFADFYEAAGAGHDSYRPDIPNGARTYAMNEVDIDSVGSTHSHDEQDVHEATQEYASIGKMSKPRSRVSSENVYDPPPSYAESFLNADTRQRKAYDKDVRSSLHQLGKDGGSGMTSEEEDETKEEAFAATPALHAPPSSLDRTKDVFDYRRSSSFSSLSSRQRQILHPNDSSRKEMDVVGVSTQDDKKYALDGEEGDFTAAHDLRMNATTSSDKEADEKEGVSEGQKAIDALQEATAANIERAREARERLTSQGSVQSVQDEVENVSNAPKTLDFAQFQKATEHLSSNTKEEQATAQELKGKSKASRVSKSPARMDLDGDFGFDAEGLLNTNVVDAGGVRESEDLRLSDDSIISSSEEGEINIDEWSDIEQQSTSLSTGEIDEESESKELDFNTLTQLTDVIERDSEVSDLDDMASFSNGHVVDTDPADSCIDSASSEGSQSKSEESLPRKSSEGSRVDSGEVRIDQSTDELEELPTLDVSQGLNGAMQEETDVKVEALQTDDREESEEEQGQEMEADQRQSETPLEEEPSEVVNEAADSISEITSTQQERKSSKVESGHDIVRSNSCGLKDEEEEEIFIDDMVSVNSTDDIDDDEIPDDAMVEDGELHSARYSEYMREFQQVPDPHLAIASEQDRFTDSSSSDGESDVSDESSERLSSVSSQHNEEPSEQPKRNPLFPTKGAVAQADGETLRRNSVATVETGVPMYLPSRFKQYVQQRQAPQSARPKTSLSASKLAEAKVDPPAQVVEEAKTPVYCDESDSERSIGSEDNLSSSESECMSDSLDLQSHVVSCDAGHTSQGVASPKLDMLPEENSLTSISLADVVEEKEESKSPGVPARKLYQQYNSSKSLARMASGMENDPSVQNTLGQIKANFSRTSSGESSDDEYLNTERGASFT